MTGAAESRTSALVVASREAGLEARATVRSVATSGGVPCTVVDTDGRYRPVGDEHVLAVGDLVSGLHLEDEATRAAATLEHADLLFYVGAMGAEWTLLHRDGDGDRTETGDQRVVVLGAGVQVLDSLQETLGGRAGMVVVPAGDVDGSSRRAAAVPTGALFSQVFYSLDTAEQASRLRASAASWRIAPTALDLLAVTVAAEVTYDPLLITPWRSIGSTVSTGPDGGLLVRGSRVCALDLTAFDPSRPWLLDATARVRPSVLLSEHPALAEVVRAEAEERSADQSAAAGLDADTPIAGRLGADLRAEARRDAEDGNELPDVLGLGTGVDPTSWALALVPPNHPHPVARQLAATRAARPQLRRTFPRVPGSDAADLARWALAPGAAKGDQDRDLLTQAAEVTLAAQQESTWDQPGSADPLPAGVNLLGFLSGELGLGESARLVDEALQSVGVPTSTFDVGLRLRSRRTATYRATEPVLYDTSLICVNGAETATLAPQLSSFMDHTRVIGMWYWELEDLSRKHQAGFEHVDEVWAATDFMRDAFAKHSGSVPVRTVTPPLPQAVGEPGVVPARFDIPAGRPWFLFTFDFLSSADRKNPRGLVEAFTMAFGDLPVDERPLLVIKTINADRQPGPAERLRLQIAGRPDIRCVDTYLDNDERHVLVANCTAYVSLHKAEGLGLTVAEAMAWGKPVITTAYGGVTQFCNEENSLLVDWQRGYVEETFGPYQQGLPWAEPDLTQAAAHLRSVIDQPDRVAAIGAQAAEDIRLLHNASAAGARMREALAEGDAQWRSARAEGGGEPAGETPEGIGRRLARSGRERLRRIAR